jgi:hypothetical protein
MKKIIDGSNTYIYLEDKKDWMDYKNNQDFEDCEDYEDGAYLHVSYTISGSFPNWFHEKKDKKWEEHSYLVGEATLEITLQSIHDLSVTIE